MKLAHIVLQHNQLGSTVRKQYVTPGEVMLLVADFHQSAGKDPIVQFDPVADDAEDSDLEDLTSELGVWEKKREALDSDSVTEEVRSSRQQNYNFQIQSVKDQIFRLMNLKALRKITPEAEKRRLVAKYGARKVNKLFPGAVPQLPSDFDEARKAGVEIMDSGASDPYDRMLAIVGN